MNPPEITAQDQSHLSLLRTFHYVVAALYFCGSLIPTIHITIGLVMIFSPESMGNGSSAPPPAFMGWLFAILGFTAMIALASLAVCQLVVARSLGQYRRHIFCMVISGLNCMNMPIGTLLGVFTILVLSRPAVRALFVGSVPERGAPYRS